MIILNVLYYYYYLFYKKVLKDDEPHLLTTMALSASEGFFVMYLIDTIWVYCFCEFLLGQWGMLAVIASMILLNYFVYHYTGKSKEIVKQEPKLYRSNWLSISITIIFFLFTSSLLFWMSDFLLIVLEDCSLVGD